MKDLQTTDTPSQKSPRSEVIIVKEGPQRVDLALVAALPQYSRSYLQRLLKEGRVVCKDVPLLPRSVVQTGDRIAVRIPSAIPLGLKSVRKKLDVLYEDKNVIVINKSPGLSVHPTPHSTELTLVNFLLAHCKKSLGTIGGVLRPGIVHRLDKDTSGVLIVAKNDATHRFLSECFSKRLVKKEYIALVEGSIPVNEGTIHGPIGRDQMHRQRMKIVPASKGRDATTAFRIEKRSKKFTLVHCYPLTGRTHQIRVHLSHFGYPIAGDVLYGGEKHPGLARFFLHAHTLTLPLAKGKKPQTFTAPLPKDLRCFLKEL